MAERRIAQRRIILAALFIALGVALGRLMAGIPNVELMTLAVFLGGAFCGMGLGAAIGALVVLAHSLLNPLGPAPPQLLAAQIIGYAVTGFAGGAIGTRKRFAGSRAPIVFAAAGLTLTLIYDVLTTLATAIVALGARGFAAGLWGIAAAGLPYAAIHIGVNTALFAAAAPPVLAAARAAEAGEAA